MIVARFEVVEVDDERRLVGRTTSAIDYKGPSVNRHDSVNMLDRMVGNRYTMISDGTPA